MKSCACTISFLRRYWF